MFAIIDRGNDRVMQFTTDYKMKDDKVCVGNEIFDIKSYEVLILDQVDMNSIDISKPLIYKYDYELEKLVHT